MINMKKITTLIFVFSLAFYALFFLALADASGAMSTSGLFACILLAIINLTNSAILLKRGNINNQYYYIFLLFILMINGILILLLGGYVLSLYVAPPRINMMG